MSDSWHGYGMEPSTDVPAFTRAARQHLDHLPTPQILYTDFDGTLLGPGGSLLTDGERRPDARAAQALVDAARSGLAVVPVSGRGRAQLAHDVRLLGLDDCIAEAGGVIVRDGTIRYEWGQAPRDLADTPHDTLVAAGALDLLLDHFDTDLRLYEPWHTGREASTLFHGLIDVEIANSLLAEAGLHWAYVVDNGRTGGWEGRSVRAYHLLPRGIGKATAVADDLMVRGLRREEAAAIGDSLEDATMASAVGTYFRVANGHHHPEVTALTTPGSMGAGFADAVRALLDRR